MEAGRCSPRPPTGCRKPQAKTAAAAHWCGTAHYGWGRSSAARRLGVGAAQVTENRGTGDIGASGLGTQDTKPESDEAHSAFTPPLGVPLPPPPEPDGSAFAPPGSAAGSTTGTHPLPSRPFHSAFTPPEGVPVIRLGVDAPWQDRMRAMLRIPVAERPAPEFGGRAE